MRFLGYLWLGLLALSFTACQQKTTESKPAKKNVLFIMVDDLRPEFGAYGKNQIVSPNLNALAEEGIQFNRAYCQVPICGASRASILTGTYPARHRFLSARTYAEKDRPGVEVIPGHFKNNGYTTISIGKIFDRDDDHKEAWSEKPIRYQHMYRWTDYHDPKNIELDTTYGLGPITEMLDVPDSTYFDGRIANDAVNYLHRFSENNEPFFLAVGFVKPHLPFTPPKKYWDLYKRDSIQLPEHQSFYPSNAPEAAFLKWTELLSYHGIEEGPLSDDLARTMIHGYMASVSYIDAQLGKVMEALKQNGLDENTTVVLLGDHGWHLGEHGVWCKKYSFQESLRVPLVINDASFKSGVNNNVVELVDLFPTLCELTDWKNHHINLAGESLVGQLQHPEAKVAGTSFSKWNDGLTLITDDYAYTQWLPKPDSIRAQMLYKLKTDPKELSNIAENPQNKVLIDSLQQQLYQLMGKDFEEKIE